MKFYGRTVLFILATLLIWSYCPAQEFYRVEDGTIYFKSDAPLELIEATSNKMRGLINPKDNSFAFAVKINTFQGFNSPLQREHFNENYMESKRYPEATFSGRIIENVSLTQPGK